MDSQILHYFGESHASHIHARGRTATANMVELVNPQKGEKILEIGFGTGATLVEMASQTKDAHYFGYEISALMCQKASERVRFCGLADKIELSVPEKKNKFPASDNTFDKVYAESIIGIQEGEDFKNILLEIQRVLKPNGEFIFNETIWLETTDRKRAQQINAQCKRAFGIIQSNDEYPHISDWKNLLTSIGFTCDLEITAPGISSLKKQKIVSLHLFLSRIYTAIGKTKAFLSATMRRQWKEHKLNMLSIMNADEKLMEGIILRAYNKK